MKLRIISAVLLFSLCLASPALSADAKAKLSSNSGFLLSGTVYKQSGAARSGIITIRTSWNLPGASPVYRYDFDILYGSTEGNLYSFMLSDIAEIEFLPLEGKRQPVNVLLRNGTLQKVILSSNDKFLMGTMNLKLDEIDVLTDRYGDNVISGGDVQKIVFSAPPAVQDESLNDVVTSLGKALQVGSRDALVDDDFMTVLQKIYSRLKTKADETGKK
jgi:hypothetical protein